MAAKGGSPGGQRGDCRWSWRHDDVNPATLLLYMVIVDPLSGSLLGGLMGRSWGFQGFSVRLSPDDPMNKNWVFFHVVGSLG